MFHSARCSKLTTFQISDPTGANQDRGDLHGANPLFIAAKYGQANGGPLLMTCWVPKSTRRNTTLDFSSPSNRMFRLDVTLKCE